MKTSLRNEFVSFLTLSRLFGPAQFAECKRFLLELNSYGLYPASKREKKIRRSMFTSSIKRHIRKFHVEVVQWTSKTCTKNVIHDQSCCFAHKTDCFLSSSSWLLKLPNITSDIYVSLLARRGSDDDDDMQLH